VSRLADLKAKMREAAGRGPRRKPASAEPETSVKKVESKRKRKDSRAKGSNFERKQAKLWSRWSGCLFRRTPGSGGWSQNPDEFGVSGDLVCDDDRFPFHFELKHREEWDLADLITDVRAKDSRSVREWWRQTVKSCPKNKVPVLVFKKNRMSPLLMVHAADFFLMKLSGAAAPTADFIPTMAVEVDEGGLYILSQEYFFSHFRYCKELRKALRRRSK
jgi:hypothetical protein